MASIHNQSNMNKNPEDFFTAATFTTLGGCVIVAYIVKSVIVGVFKTKPELTSFIVSIFVAYAGLIILSKKISLKSAIVTLFNGFLIYFTLVGGTSYLTTFTDKTADEEFREKKPFTAAFITPLNQDKNLVKKSVTLEGKVQILGHDNESLRRKNEIYKEDIDSLEADFRAMDPSATVQRNTVLNEISAIKDRISQIPVPIKKQTPNKIK
ncbi:MAG: hypothetical protein ACFFDN_07630 [Candidatus Hodarchaeota archaeon]